MNKKGISIIGILLLLAFIGCAQSIDMDAEKASIEEALSNCYHAVQDQDWAALAAVSTDNMMHYNHMGDKWNMEDLKGFFTDHITNHTINISNVNIHVSGDGSLAWATVDEATEYQFDGNPVKENAIFTFIFEKEGTDWKVAHFHRSMPSPTM